MDLRKKETPVQPILGQLRITPKIKGLKKDENGENKVEFDGSTILFVHHNVDLETGECKKDRIETLDVSRLPEHLQLKILEAEKTIIEGYEYTYSDEYKNYSVEVESVSAENAPTE